MLNKFTFGDSKASIVLAEKVSLIDKTKRKDIARLLQNFNAGLNQLKYIPDFHIRMALANVWFRNFKNHKVTIDDSIIKSYLGNVISYRWKEWNRKQPHLEYINERQKGNTKWQAKVPKLKVDK